MKAFKGALYIGTGIQNGGYDHRFNVGPAAAEIIRLRHDGSWDIVVGNARDGKTPISGLGAGFNNYFCGYIWRMGIHDGWLYVGTMDWSVILRFTNLEKKPLKISQILAKSGVEDFIDCYGGSELWRTFDGENWLPVTKTGFGNPYNYGIRNIISSPHGLFVETANPFGPTVAVRQGDDWDWTYEDNPKGGLEVWQSLNTLELQVIMIDDILLSLTAAPLPIFSMASPWESIPGERGLLGLMNHYEPLAVTHPLSLKNSVFETWLPDPLLSWEFSKNQLLKPDSGYFSQPSSFLRAKRAYQSVDSLTGLPIEQVVKGELTQISSRYEGIISSRHQDHAWITPDAVNHIMVKDDAQPNSLTIYTDLEGSNNWQPTASLPDTGQRASSDGVLFGDTLSLAYSASDGGIYFRQLRYDPSNHTWQSLQSSLIFQNVELAAQRPTLAIDANNDLWATFTTQDAQGEGSTKLLYSDSAGQSWSEVALDLGKTPPDSRGSSRRSSKVVASNDGLTIIYTDGNSLNYAASSNPLAIDSWKQGPLFDYADAQKDPDGTHFSVVVDQAANLHIATNDGNQRLLYLKYDRQQERWQSPRRLTDFSSAAYMQVSVSQKGSILISYDARLTPNNPANPTEKNPQYLEVIESLDGGQTFSLNSRLLYRPDLEKGNPRVETPAYIRDTLPIFQQVANADDSLQGLAYFQVSVS